jgi:hypothetical protein
MISLIHQQRNESPGKIIPILQRKALATTFSFALLLGALTAGAQQDPVIGPDIDSAKDKTVAWGTDWSFDEPKLHKGTCPVGDVDVDIVYTITNSLCGRSYQATRKWEAKDNCGNKDTCKQIVTVLDASAPMLFAMPDKTVECGAAWEFDLPTAINAADGSSLSITVVAITTNQTASGITAICTWETADGCGQTARCSQSVSVVDSTPPILVSTPDKTVELGEAWFFDAPTGFDTCSENGVTIRVTGTVTNHLGGLTFSAIRSWTVADASGNIALSSQSVTVTDTTPPTLVGPADLYVRAGSAWTFGTPEASDNGGAVTLIVEGTVTNRICGGSFIARRSWRATDASGNSTLCSQTVTVTDGEPPTLICAAAKVVEAGSVWNFDAPTAFDAGEGVNLPAAIIGTTTNNPSGGSVIVTRTWRATDACGNSAECSQVVTIVDTAPPVFVSVPAGALYRCFGDVPPAPVIEALDSGDGQLIATCRSITNGICPTFIVHTWTASDRRGNTATASQTNMVFINPPRIVAEPSDRTACAGERVELCLELSGVCAVSYEWLKDGQPLVGTTGPCLVLNSVSESDSGTYSVRVSGNFCPDGEPQLARSAQLTVHPQLSVAPLADVARRAGEMATFRTTVAGTALSCVWRRNGEVIPGENGASLSIPSTSVADAGEYSVEVNGPCGSVSQRATLTVLAEPSPGENSRPFLSSITDRVLQNNESTGEIPFTIGDAETSAGELFVSASSSDPMLLPLANIILGGTGANRTVMVVAPSAGSGEVTVTLTVSDGRDTAGTSFKVSIAPPGPVRSRLTICVHGDGVVTPDLNGQELLVGQTYTVRAVHGVGQMFTGWTGAVSGSEPLLSFVMTPNLMLNVGFAPNPYLALPGNYNGLFHEADAVRHDTSGFVSLTRNKKGGYSGLLRTGGRLLRFAGKFDALGNATNVIRPRGASAFAVEFHLGAGDQPDEISGTVTSGSWAAGLLADRAAFHAVTNRAPYAGRYTMIIPGQPLDETLPAGDGFGTMVVGPGGRVTFAGTLADGRKVAQAVPLGRGGEWPLYAALYRGRGSVLSWQTFGNRPTEDVGGVLNWIRPPLADIAPYASGFSHATAATGSRYTKPRLGVRVLDVTEGLFNFCGGTMPMFANSFLLRPDNKILNQSANALESTINLRNGLFRGCVVSPAGGVMEPFKGALLQKQNRGSGFCPGTNGVGRVTFEPAR